jgi:hypothetical protein
MIDGGLRSAETRRRRPQPAARLHSLRTLPQTPRTDLHPPRIAIIDDNWLTLGSANLNEHRSSTTRHQHVHRIIGRSANEFGGTELISCLRMGHEGIEIE